jgi:hypothetical protein
MDFTGAMRQLLFDQQNDIYINCVNSLSEFLRSYSDDACTQHIHFVASAWQPCEVILGLPY